MLHRFALAASLTLAVLPARGADDVPLRNWKAPAVRGVHGLADVSNMLPFVAITPCRLLDTRTGAGTPLAAGVPRDFTLTGVCGLPTDVAAVSLNVTVTNTAGPGYVTLYPQGTAWPGVSTINYVGGQTVANAALVPLGSGGAVTALAGVSGTDLVLDTNGYFPAALPASQAFLRIFTDSSQYAIWGHNVSTSCSGPCGVRGDIETNASGASAVAGYGNSTSGVSFGVYGYTGGKGPNLAPESNSAGVFGEAVATTGSVSGVLGKTISTNGAAAGVQGLATDAGAGAGIFTNLAPNNGGPITAILGTVFGSRYALYSVSGGVKGTFLEISGAKMFIAPHPEDPSKEIRYVAVEAPTSDVYFRGTARLVHGAARIEVPDHFRLTAREGSYMASVTPVGARAVLWVESQGSDGIVVRGTGDAAFNYVVYAERDLERDHKAVDVNTDFTPEALAKGGGVGSLAPALRDLLVKNGTLKEDGTFDERTAERLGWKLPAPP